MQLSKNAEIVLKKKYLKKLGNKYESPESMFRRIAKNISKGNKKLEKEFYDIMINLEFLPNTPTLRNAGRVLQQLAACFVLPVGDSMEDIFQSVKNMALIQKTGGGTGFSFSRLRPEGSRVGETGGIASGPVSFMKVFDTATGAIKEGGIRRGANMGILRIDHPDIIKFITAKKDPSQLTNFNISVAVTSEFMEAVKSNSNYDLINPHTKEVAGQLNAKEVFEKMVEMAWKTGDPGIVFIEHINEHNPTPKLGKISCLYRSISFKASPSPFSVRPYPISLCIKSWNIGLTSYTLIPFWRCNGCNDVRPNSST